MPSINTLKSCWNGNPHGAGFMWKDDKGIVQGLKGFMNWLDFKEAWEAQTFQEQDTIVVHFRIATTGAIRPENCHPFPVTKKVTLLEQLDFSTRMAIAHNGTFGSGDGDLSDTMLWIKNYFVHFKNEPEQVERDLGHNRVVVLGKGMAQPLLLGAGWYQLEGCFYSNLNWCIYQKHRSFKTY